MGTHPGRTADEWAGTISEAYAARTRPPLTPQLVDEVRQVIAAALREAAAAISTAATTGPATAAAGRRAVARA